MQEETFRIITFDVETADDATWLQLTQLLEKQSRERNPNDPPISDDLLKKSVLANNGNPETSRDYRLVVRDDEGIGFSIVQFVTDKDPEYESKKHVAYASIFVLPDYRQQGIGRALLGTVVHACNQRGVTLLQGTAELESGHGFATHFGGEVGIETATRRLPLADTDWDLMQQWVDDGTAKNSDITIETYDTFLIMDDEDDYAEFCRVYTEMMNQQPYEDIEGAEEIYTPERMRHEEEQMKQLGMTWWLKVAYDDKRDIAGVTEIMYHPERGHRVGQGLTAVRDSFRGRKIGKWLKADMMLHIREVYPDAEYVSTGNADVNSAMLAINEKMGFRLYKRQVVYKLDVSALSAKFD
ncbi:MAG: GNAT family N-acetyltransferase [Chloroflexota bacterium]